MHYFDEIQVEFWRSREREERAAAAQAGEQSRPTHLRLADSYAVLIAQTIGAGPEDANA